MIRQPLQFRRILPVSDLSYFQKKREGNESDGKTFSYADGAVRKSLDILK